MALRRTKYGVEFDPGREERSESSGIGWIVVLVTVLASVSFVWLSVGRIRNRDAGADDGVHDEVTIASAADEPSAPPPPRADGTPAAARDERPPAPPAATNTLVVSGFSSRPNNVRQLLLKLDEVTRTGNIEMQIATIEKLRALPGEQVADVDAELVRRLGELNMTKLVTLRARPWVKEVEVRRGQSATRIARENGSTLGSVRMLNPGLDVERLRPGMKILVMDRPDFSLIVHKTLRTVDFNMHDKLFKRYRLEKDAPEIALSPGRYETPANLREYFRLNSIGLSPGDVQEIDNLTPKGSAVIVSDN